ncbi:MULTISPECIES: hypothetical protein [Planktothricoides]|uniref:Uncharacterized protein n=2 Tax=Planktothricoides raciborskii TaxID=132608 RepID=A0AAU8J8N6_9CYAN|nr:MULTISPECIES: hypothetical protein [Planktothricoides]MBD2543965.1 hypothetical protein [Planktothricoides raciborskii FACHB-1370]MBD2582953.1 hypothetical protein [Planktothricoides raciborskii FACHB-1261]
MTDPDTFIGDFPQLNPGGGDRASVEAAAFFCLPAFPRLSINKYQILDI